MKALLARFRAAWDRFWFLPVSPSSIAAFRIGFGALSLLNALYYLPDFMTWFGVSGASPIDAIAQLRPTLFTRTLAAMALDDAFYWSVLWLQIAASLTALLGFYTKTSLVVLWVARLILFHRNPYLWHQIDILLRIYGLLLLVCPAGEMYSVDSYLRRRGDPQAPLRHFAPWGQRLIQLQSCLIYAEAFLGKLAGPDWRDGTAVYYATHFPDGLRHTFPVLLDRLWVHKGLTYFTLAIELSLFLLIWIKPLRYPILVGGVLFHLGIHWFIQLDLLEFGAMLPFLCFIDPQDMERWVARGCRSLGFRMSSREKRSEPEL